MKFRNKIFIISLMLIILLGISCASASEEEGTLANDTMEVLTSNDDVEVQTEENNDELLSNNEEDKLSTAGSFADLSHEIIESYYGTLVLKNSYENKGNEQAIPIELDTTIDGKGHTIDAMGKSGIFLIKNTEKINLVLKNIVFKNAYGDSGGAIQIKTEVNVDCTIKNCTFIQNQAKDGGAAIYFSNEDGSLEIKDSTFKNNYALYAWNHKTHGGAIYIDDGELIVQESDFVDNDARGHGGAIYSTVKSEIIWCTFNRNYALNRGGSVFLSNSESYITDSNFTTSSCEGEGGAVYSEKDFLLLNSNFIDCYAEDNGGAIYVKSELKIRGDYPSRFINNRVSVGNVVYANKGGAIYAGKFNSDVNGFVFINNRAWYGGAIYINNKNEVTFKSCYFEGNVAKDADGTSGCGAAIYLDSSSSKISLVNNIFINNEAVDDKAVYNCGKYDTISNNWWGTNTPNFNDPYLLEWHRVGSNDKRSDKDPLKLLLVGDKSEVTRLENVRFNIKFVNSEGSDLTSEMKGFNVVFTSDKKANFTSTGSKSNVIFTPLESGVHTITAKLSNFELKSSINVMGDFASLQNLVNNAQDVLNLERDYIYSVGLDTITEGILINKVLTINGNGHAIDALGKSRIFNVASNGVTINDVVFKNGNAPDGGIYDEYKNHGSAIFLNNVRNSIVSNSRFISNYAGQHGGAIYSEEGDNTQILNCYFESNSARYWGGAVDISTPNSKIQNCIFINNTAESGGAFNVEREASNVVLNNSRFINNSASSGGAAEFYALDCRVENSLFLSNRASAKELTSSVEGNLTFTFTGKENYINAIYSDKDLTISNVTYWNGIIVNGDNPVRSDAAGGVNITIEIMDSENRLVKNIVLVTDVNGQVKYDYSELEDGDYTFKANHLEDGYYTSSSATGDFKVTHMAPNPSSVTITTPNKKEFTHDYVHIDFTYENRTEIRVLITNYNGSDIFYDYLAGLNFVEPILPASDEYYNITVFNIGNETFQPSKDSILFKVNKINSTMEINLDTLTDISYNSPRVVKFTGDIDCHDYNVTIYDENNTIVHSSIVFVAQTEGSMQLPLLNVGNYNITVINLGNVNKKAKNQTASFKVVKADNNFNVTVDDNVFGKEITVTVRADVDGEYLVKINSTNVTVRVVEGVGSEIVELGAGYYTANVTFANANYNNNATNDTFTIQKAQSHVGIEDFGDVLLNQSRTIRFTDFYMTKFNVIIYNEGNVVVSSENSSSLVYNIPKLSEVGTYNITVTNLGNENVWGSQASYIFNVVNTNNVEVIVDDEDYGRELLIVVAADVDGLYTVNVNGTEVVVEVVDGVGFDDTLQLPAGNYSANVTFDNLHYINNITNATFTIFKAESNLQIYEIGNVTYGADVVVRFYDDYPTSYYIEVLDQDNKVVFNITFTYGPDNQNMIVILADFAAGKYIVNIQGEGDDNIISTGDSTTFNVTKLTPVIYVNADDVIYPDEVVVNVLVDVNGTYYVSLAGQTVKADLIAGEAYDVVFGGVEVGNYTITVTYPETENYTAAVNNEMYVEVFDFEFDLDTETTGENTTLVIHVPANATGKIVVTANGQNYTANVTNGTAVVTIPDLKVDDEILISFISDGKYPNKTQNTTNALINSTIVSENMNRGYNSGMDFQATIIDGLKRPIANATVTIIINGKRYTVVSDAKGLITINQKFAVGTYLVTLINPFNNKITSNALEIVTRITGNKNVNTYYGKNYQYKLRIIGDNGSPVGAGVSVKVTINGKAKTLKTDKNGYITVKFTKTYLPKTYTVTAEYMGIKVSNKVVVKKVLTLKKVTVKRSAKKLVLKATLKEGKKALKGKKVVFKFKGKKYTAKTNKKGIAKVTIKKKVLQKLKKGKKVKYQVTYLKHTVKRTAKVKR